MAQIELDFRKLKTIPLADRKNIFTIDQMINPEGKHELSENKEIECVAKAMLKAKVGGSNNIIFSGAHPIKLGLSRFYINMMEKGLIDHLALNGAGAVHDLEIALIGGTSEDVAQGLRDGSFGMAEETGRYINGAAINAFSKNLGFGKSLGMMIRNLEIPHKELSIFYKALENEIPITIHTSIGAEIFYQHPLFDGATVGAASGKDFHSLTKSLAGLNHGVVLNIGSAVVLPEVFLKSLTMARNLGYAKGSLTTANFDMLEHYRTKKNVVERPTQDGGIGYDIREMHQKSIPTLYHHLTKNFDEEKE